MIYIAYYTKNTHYQEIVETHLHPSLHHFNLNHDIVEVENLGTWKLNTGYKPTFILNMLEKHNQDLVYIDVDAIIKKYPILFSEIPQEYNLGVHYLSWKIQYNSIHRDKYELLSGTIFIRNNTITKKLLKHWRLIISHHIQDQKALDEALTSFPSIKIFKLPREYCYIPINPNGKKPNNFLENPIICHYQASRKYKRKEDLCI